MNKVVLMGRLTRDPEVRYSQGENPLAIARFTLAVDRRFRRDGEQSAEDVYKRQDQSCHGTCGGSGSADCR